MLPKFKKLLKSVDYLHIKALNKLKIKGLTSNDMRKGLFEWALNSIMNPKIGIPLIGTIKLNKDIAPWYDQEYKDFIFFEEHQLKMLRYFSKDQTNENLLKLSVLMVATWYHHTHPKEYISLSKIASVENAHFQQ
ncbi:hypothetical protein PGT21_024452 [Puccinia graminis f. sp. tritici]|uniref:Uncharacterized protein n=1 Tax=Puccinia graminis f. sp. tritici TaxID=56615 RepID=A0A5B0PUU4_PUCGR|nr:hypothetical protein PGTUg99_023993 [Puccinia graminis f. sp. tritici]KAA1104464.1 hypothetical protein PGT21_024452 [Puccinia graminis f. sp. tritici]